MPFTMWGARELGIGAGVFAIGTIICLAFFRHFGSCWYLTPIVPLAILFGWMLWFFRDPPRTVPQEAGVIVSPADGTITHLDTADEPDYIGGNALRCSIFLSIFSVHLNRAPASGKVEFVQFRPGEFFDARREESLTKNQNQDVGIACDEPGYPSRMVVRQSTGAIARNIVCPVTVGEQLRRGGKYGMIKFGSRTTLFLSPDAKIEWAVKVGDPVKAGETVVARIVAAKPSEAKEKDSQ